MNNKQESALTAQSSSFENFNFDVVIGLEIHIQLATKTKLFCGCKNAYGGLPNNHTCPVCLGLPGVLPVLNSHAVDCAIAMALAIGANIRKKSVFARKQYFYPDLPKGYQITQYDLPYCTGGGIVLDNGRYIDIERIHIEEDAGKSTHSSSNSYVDLNRAGLPLLEMVSKPVLASPKEASGYLKKVRSIVRFLEISDGNMEEGSFRCDANISLKQKGAAELGTRTEIKNLNSFRNVERALKYEIFRQADLLTHGEKVRQETLRFDAEAGKTISSRSKEQTADYRYLPDPDLGPLTIKEARINKIKSGLCELPAAVEKRYIEKFQLSEKDARIITEEKEISDFFTLLLGFLKNVSPSTAANFLTTEFLRELKEKKWDLKKPLVSAKELAELLDLVGEGQISGKIAKVVFSEMISSGKKAAFIVKSKGLSQVQDSVKIAEIVDRILMENPAQLESYLNGKDKIFGFLIGQAMKISNGTLSPSLLNKILGEKLNEKKSSKS